MGENTKDKISVLVVDDHPVVLKGIKSYLGDIRDITVVGEAIDGVEAVEKAVELEPDVILLDFNMPGMDGLEATKQLREKVPDSKILVFTMFDADDVVLNIMKAGAHGYILKSAFNREFIQAIHTVHDGDVYLGSDVAKILLEDYIRKTQESGRKRKDKTGLTRRERRVLLLIAEGMRNKEIAQQLNVSIRTVEAHREKIRKKLGVSSPAGLTKYAMDHAISLKEEL